MADKSQRGTKRTCQNGSCGQRFYDLNRDPILCPICGAQYAIAHSPVEPERVDAARRPVRKPEPVPVVAEAGEVPEVEAEDALADVEGGEEPIAASEDETFLEEEDEGGDVSGILGGGGGEEDEES
jgi:uncharacterized protein (TIGR02300 family)